MVSLFNSSFYRRHAGVSQGVNSPLARSVKSRVAGREGQTLHRAFIVFVVLFGGWCGALASPIVLDNSFESINLGGGYQYDPTTTPWVFSSVGAGIASAGVWFSGPPADGVNAAFMQGNSSYFEQDIAGFTVGEDYDVSFFSATRPSYSPDPFDITLGGMDLGVYGPIGNFTVSQTTGPITATSTSMLLVFAGTANFDADSDIDLITINDVGLGNPAPSATPESSSFGLAALAIASLIVTRKRLQRV